MIRPQPAFTLVETLVAITVLVIAIVGPLYAIHRSVVASYAARDNLIATSLAQEAVEFVRSIRDTNYLSGSSWLTGLNACRNTNGCIVDPGTGSITVCGAGPNGCPALSLHPTTRLYTQNSGLPQTRFRRRVFMEPVGPGNTQMKVTVTVTWSTGRVGYTATVVEHIYNWL